jgi:hypothetical protein
VGREGPLGTRNDGVGVLCVCFLTVEARERTDAMEPEGDFGRDAEELSWTGRRRLAARPVTSVMILS